MKIKQLLNLLSFYPQLDVIRFYCPTNQTYYYVKEALLKSGRLILTDDTSKIRGHTYKTFLDYYHMFPEIHNNEFKIIIGKRHFKIQ